MTRTKFRIGAFALAQALALTCAVISVSITALVGKSLAPTPSLSTLPYGVQFAIIIFSAYLVSIAMKRFGRRPVFLLSTVVLIIAGLVGGFSIINHSFLLNNIAHICLGITLSSYAYFRFAATDGLEESQKSKAISLVTFGGIAAAFIAPTIAKKTKTLIDNADFAASYFSLTAIAIVMFLLLLIIPKADNKQDTKPVEKDNIDNPSNLTSNADNVNQLDKSMVNHKSKIPKHRLVIAIYSSGFGYMLMGMLMTQSVLNMNSLNIPYGDITIIIQYHVVAMFLPSLFMGKLVSRFGIQTIIMVGYIVMLIAIFIAIFTEGYYPLMVALIFLGVGWNMLYVGGSSLVAVLPGDSHKLQGINESSVAVLNTIGAFAAGLLFASIGWVNSNWVSLFFLIPGIILLLSGWNKVKHNKD